MKLHLKEEYLNKLKEIMADIYMGDEYDFDDNIKKIYTESKRYFESIQNTPNKGEEQ